MATDLPKTWRLVRMLGMPAGVLVQAYALERAIQSKRNATAAGKKQERGGGKDLPRPRRG